MSKEIKMVKSKNEKNMTNFWCSNFTSFDLENVRIDKVLVYRKKARFYFWDTITRRRIRIKLILI